MKIGGVIGSMFGLWLIWQMIKEAFSAMSYGF